MKQKSSHQLDVPLAVLVAGKVAHMLEQVLDDLEVAFAEGGAEAGEFARVHGVRVGAARAQRLHAVEVAVVGGEPEGGLAALVGGLEVGARGHEQLDEGAMALKSNYILFFNSLYYI